MKKVLVSACLLGCKVRYNGNALEVDNQSFEKLSQQYEIISFCPEVSAGLPTPRASAEIQCGQGEDVLQGVAKVMAIDGTDVSDYFCRGAQLALDKCLEENISLAILSESSPSCGSSLIYDGQFQGVKKKGRGVTAALLNSNGIKVYSQHEVSILLETVD